MALFCDLLYRVRVHKVRTGLPSQKSDYQDHRRDILHRVCDKMRSTNQDPLDPNFESEIIREMCKLMGVKKSRTTPYYTQGNAGPERFTRTLLEMLGTLDPDKKKDWRNYINPVVYAYNCTPHEATRVAQHELMF